jgi:hypothetical protein
MNGFVMPIPKVIHRSVPASTTPLMDSCWKSVIKLTPDYLHLTHLDGDEFEFITEALRRCEQGAFRADLIRLEALYLHGGIYLDSDVELFKTLDSLLQLEVFAVSEVSGEKDYYGMNAIMGARPKNPIIFEMLELSCKLILDGQLKYPYNLKNSQGDSLTFGPYVVNEVKSKHPELVLLPPSDFLTCYKSPILLSEFSQLNPLGKHHYAASWHFGGDGFEDTFKIKSRRLLRSIKHKLHTVLIKRISGL